MKSESTCVLTINSGSSSIRFAVYEAGEELVLKLEGKIDRIGLSGTTLIVHDPTVAAAQRPRRLAAADHRTATMYICSTGSRPSRSLRRSKRWDTA